MRAAVRVVLAGAVVCLAASPGLGADNKSAAKDHYDKATTEYALAHYLEAAKEFEQAFALKPDPALLYNVAQAYRLAGEKAHALEIYRNCQRMYARRCGPPGDADRRIKELEAAIAAERPAPGPVPLPAPASRPAPTTVATPPPARVAAAPPPVSPAPLPPAPSPRAEPATSTLVRQSPSPGDTESPPVYKRWWFWTGVGAVVAGAVITAVLLSGRKVEDCGGGVDACANLGGNL